MLRFLVPGACEGWEQVSVFGIPFRDHGNRIYLLVLILF